MKGEMMSKKNNKYWDFKNQGERTATLKIYGEISKYAWWDNNIVTASDFVNELESLEDIDTLNLCINSLGGSVTEATAIYNALKRYSAENSVNIVTHIDGVAASAASFIAMAGNEICMGVGANLMIHNVNGGASGESKDLRKTADLMDRLKDNIIDIYRTQSNLSKEEISNLMDNSTWMSPEEALEHGFIDKIETYEEVEDSTLSNLFTKEFTNYVELPARVKEFRNKAKEPKIKNTKETSEGGDKEMPGTTFTQEELNNKVEEARAAERKRIQDLDNIYAPTEEAKNMVDEAKYAKPLTPQEVAYNIMTTDSFKAHKEVEAIAGEQEVGGVNKIVNQSPPKKEEGEKEEIENDAAAIANLMNETRGI